MGTALHTEARRLASTGEWGSLCTLLQGDDRLGGDAELSVLQGEGLLRTGRPAEARDLLAQVCATTPALPGDALMRRAVNLCGAAHFELGELDDAGKAFAQAADLAREDGDALLEARTTNNLALIASIRGRHAEALALYRVALPVYQRLGNYTGLAQSLHNMAITQRDVGALDAAEQDERRAVEYARAAGDERMEAIATVGRAEILLRRGDLQMAEATARWAVENLRRLGDKAREADAWRLVADAVARASDLEGAVAVLERALACAREVEATLIEAECLRLRAEVLARRGEGIRAASDMAEAARRFRKLGMRDQAEAADAWRATGNR